MFKVLFYWNFKNVISKVAIAVVNALRWPKLEILFHFFQHICTYLCPMTKGLWTIRVDQRFMIVPQKNSLMGLNLTMCWPLKISFKRNDLFGKVSVRDSLTFLLCELWRHFAENILPLN